MLFFAAIGQDTLLDAAFKQIERRLQDVQRRNALEPLHLCDREVAHADCANLALLEERAHGLGGFLDGDQRVRPMNLIDVDVIGLQSAQ